MTDDLVKQSIEELQDLVRCRCHEAYSGRGLQDPECDCDSADAVKVVADRIKALEDKLAKAVGALRFYAWENEARLPSEGPWGVASTDFGQVARATLAELTGEKK